MTTKEVSALRYFASIASPGRHSFPVSMVDDNLVGFITTFKYAGLIRRDGGYFILTRKALDLLDNENRKDAADHAARTSEKKIARRDLIDRIIALLPIVIEVLRKVFSR